MTDGMTTQPGSVPPQNLPHWRGLPPRPMLDSVQDLSHVGAFTLDRTALQVVHVEAVARALLAPCLAFRIERAVIEVFKGLDLYRHGRAAVLAQMCEQEQTFLNAFQAGQIPVYFKLLIGEKDLSRAPEVSAAGAFFE